MKVRLGSRLKEKVGSAPESKEQLLVNAVFRS